MATLVKFLKKDHADGYEDLYAYFPQLNYNKKLYGNTQKMCYCEVGQHSSIHVDYAKDSVIASLKEYKDLLKELKKIGYADLKVLNK